MGAAPSAPSEAHAADLKGGWESACREAAATIRSSDVLLLLTGAGFSADSGLAVYADVACVTAYAQRRLKYHDICQPHWLAAEPQLFWGFWGQCFNDYRETAPHVGYEWIDQWAERFFRNSETAMRIRGSQLSSAGRGEAAAAADGDSSDGPYAVQDRAGAFFAFTSNVDAHHFDWFRACEIRECHGNTELYQCAAECSQAVWRAPASYAFRVNKTTMLAPEGASAASSPGGAAAGRREEDTGAAAGEEAPRIGEVRGHRRTTTLRHMPAARGGDSLAGFESNHPVCRSCGGPARPAILMFGDTGWIDLEDQRRRWNSWRAAVQEEASARTVTGRGPLRVAILEIGAGGNVTTVRNQGESCLKEFINCGADTKLIRVNPDLPLGDAEEYAPGGMSEKRVISVMARGLESLRLIDAAIGSGS